MLKKYISIIESLRKTARVLSNPFTELLKLTELARLDIPAADKAAILSLGQKYNRYQKTLAPAAGPAQLPPRLTDEEKDAYYLSGKKRQTTAETSHYKKLLREIARRHDPLQYLAQARAADLSGLDTYGRALVQNLIASRQAMLELDRGQTERQTITFVFSVYQDLNRLQPQSAIFTGENFLAVKCQQLDYLFEGLQNFDWQLLLAEDEYYADTAKTKSSTVAQIRKLLDTPQLSPFAAKVKTFFPEELLPELAQYQKHSEIFKRIFAPADPLEQVKRFTENSHKGGMIQLLLRKALTGQPAAIIYTDSDTSHDLGVSGLLLKELYTGQAAAVIASRRIPGAVVANKSRERNLYSTVYHLLVELGFGLGVKDTQSGLKALRPEALRAVHSQFTELGMSFDVELLKLLQNAGYQIAEIPAVWRDSPYESRSADQAAAMAGGLLRIYQTIYRQEKNAGLEDLLARLQAEPEYPALRRLAENPKLTAFTRNSFKLLARVQVKDIRDFLRLAQQLIEQLAYDPDAITQDSLEKLLAAGRRCFNILRRSHLLDFLTANYPELLPALELLRKDRRYLKIIFPLFFGRNIISALLGVDGAAAIQRGGGGGNESLSAWLAHYTADIQAARNFKPASLTAQTYTPGQLARINAAVDILRNTLPRRTAPLKVGLVFLNNRRLDPDSLAILRTHLRDLQSHIQGLPNLQFEIVIAGADSSRPTPAEEQNHLQSLATEQIRITYLPVSDEFAKGKFIRHAWAVLSRQHNPPELLAFMDHSYKISILETLPLLAWTLENYHNPEDAVLIGSRRLELSEVLNKSQALELRSLVLNILIKSLFPKLQDVADTQTGLKIVGRNVWEKLDTTPWSADGYGWEIELLNKAAVVYDRDKIIKEQLDKLPPLAAQHETFLKKLFSQPFWTTRQSGPEQKEQLKKIVEQQRKILSKLQEETFWLMQDNPSAITELLLSLFSAELDYDNLLWAGIELDKDPKIAEQTLLDLFKETSWAEKIESLVAKIENLQQLPEIIKEFPVAFNDNTSQLNITSGEKAIWNVLEEMLKILAAAGNYTYSDPHNELKFIAGGADGMVFEYRNKVLKIPNENFDVDFYDMLKYLLLPDRKTMRRQDYAQRLVEHSLTDKLTGHPLLSRLIPHLRAWPEANSFILRLISLAENKDYKSTGYPLAFQRGKNLIIPMSRQKNPFQADYRGRTYHFTPEDNILVMPKAEVVRSRLHEIIKKNDLPGFNALLNDVTALMHKLWKRGLFDMDTNIIADLGYYRGRLYLLDPGELINNPDPEILRHLQEYLQRRTDYIELRSLLAGHKPAAEMLAEYCRQMNALFDYMSADLRKQLEQKRGDFNSDRGDFTLHGPEIIQGHYKSPAHNYRWSKQHYLFFSKAEMNKKYTPFQKSLPVVQAAEPARVAYFQNPGDAQVKQVLECEALAQPLQKNVIFAVQGGQGFRTGLLGLAAGGKENIRFNGRPLSEWVLASNAKLLQARAAQPLIAIVSIDNYMEYRQEDIDNIEEYFALPETPGAFFYDLPAYSQTERMPETLEELTHYFMNSEIFWRDFRYFQDNIPFVAGPARRKKNILETLPKAALANWQTFLPAAEYAESAENRQSSSLPSFPFAAQTAAILKRFILYASNQRRGVKAPYTVIMTQDFLNDLRQEIDPKIPNYVGHEITWHTLFCALKYDQFLWKMLKPKPLDSAVWQDLYQTMRALGSKHHIYLDPQANHPQNKLRVFYGSWAALDNPWYDIIKFAKHNSVKVRGMNIYVEKRFPAPMRAAYQKIIQNCANNDVVIMGDPRAIKGIIKIAAKDFKQEQSKRKTLLYNISLPDGYVIELPKNHMLVQLASPPDGALRYYSMTIRPLSRTDLGREMVYDYELNTGNNTYTASPHQPYEDFFNERFNSSYFQNSESQP
ncbi:MAG: hypothetical protein LBJ25_05210 [Candidatus Margulisbacteria bacterium]|jgi:hypothetical protein|nr:hypothetical protein [Candidatus Margulisiibacteriota bacterium]